MPETSREIREELERTALKYLERFDSSVMNLCRVLQKKLRSKGFGIENPQGLTEQINLLVERYRASGLLDDQRYALSIIRGLRARGLARRAIVVRLRAKGVEASVIEAALDGVEEASGDSELLAARRYIKRRRLGPYRSEPQSPKLRRKDLEALARAGFDFETARQALGAETHDDEDVF